jgi:hypothetical protein
MPGVSVAVSRLALLAGSSGGSAGASLAAPSFLRAGRVREPDADVPEALKRLPDAGEPALDAGPKGARTES